AALVGNDDALEVGGLTHASFHAHQLLLRPVRQPARRQVLIRGANGLDDLIDTDAERTQLFGLEEYLHLTLHRAAHHHAAYAVGVLQTLGDLLIHQRRDLTQITRLGEHAQGHRWILRAV